MRAANKPLIERLVGMKQHWRKLIDLILMVAAVSLILTGFGLVVIYLWEGVILRAGDPDQSPLFWYLPVLIMGVFGLIGGFWLLKKTSYSGKK